MIRLRKSHSYFILNFEGVIVFIIRLYKSIIRYIMHNIQIYDVCNSYNL